jgi:hypothetical protein
MTLRLPQGNGCRPRHRGHFGTHPDPFRYPELVPEGRVTGAYGGLRMRMADENGRRDTIVLGLAALVALFVAVALIVGIALVLQP